MKINEYLSVNDAADFLGVNPQTIRLWTKSGKLKTHINPFNNYKLYKVEDLQKVLEGIDGSSKTIEGIKNEL